ncbi:glycosyltransferase family 4 protein [Emcibacter sp. SYSU 3D8]|uniref:glycosyltransferase family 4 protein n=1 Tax=Emcibacter sp. SYSU 3D8 TaxID=3133969 RepID=UPI0031FEE775
MSKKYAFFGPAHLSGVTTFYNVLAAGLAPRGIELKRIGVRDRKPVHDSGAGTLIDRAGLTDRQLAGALYRAVMDGGYDGVFFNILVEPHTANLARYLPESMTKVLILHGIGNGMYTWARAIRDWLHHTIAIAPRMHEDLPADWGFDAARVSLIPHGVGAPFAAEGRERPDDGVLRVLVAGRLADADKGCLWIPDILAPLGDVTLELTVAGDGADRAALERRLARIPHKVSFTGPVSQDVLAGLYRRSDVLLFPSRTEGFALVLLEAMASGCVPVASQIRGVTDAAVTDGHDGLLFPIGQTASATAALRRLAQDRPLLHRLSAAAAATAATRFTLERQMDAYAALLDRLDAARPPVAPALDMARWNMAAGLRPRLRSRLPQPVKVWLRTAAEKWR